MPDDERGLTTEEAAARLAREGPNLIPDAPPHALRDLLSRLWGPVPWMLEAVLALEVWMRKPVDATIVFALLVFNAGIGFAQERRSRDALELLRRRLRVTARVRRDGAWRTLPAEQLVPGDLVHLRMGDLLPADVRLVDGAILVDQSALTGESAPVDLGADGKAFSGSVVRRGEASGLVEATGSRSYFGRTAGLVSSAKTASHLESLVIRIVEALTLLDGLFAAVVVAFALVVRAPLLDLAPYVLMLLVASVPVALPATFTLATALGSIDLARRGVLVTRLSAVEEAAAMQVLCSDKTGTLTRNELTLVEARPYAPFDDARLRRLAALASDRATQDPLDLAILAAAPDAPMERERFTPFDPSTKRAEATVVEAGETIRVMKGAPAVIARAADDGTDVAADVAAMASAGRRVLGVAATVGGALRVAGLLAFEDPPRPDAERVVTELARLGVRVVMLTGDGEATAVAVARAVGLRGIAGSAADVGERSGVDVVAGMLPGDKHEVVRALQRGSLVVGMTGDGVNDAPALKQAEVGVAVSTAGDVAKAAASLVLTEPGLGGLVTAIDAGRRIYQRMLTYTLNKIVKTLEIGLFLTLGFLATGSYVTTPRHVLLLLFTNDFLTMSIATDRVEPSSTPDRWNVRSLVGSALVLAVGWLVASLGVVLVARRVLALTPEAVHSLSFFVLVVGGQSNVYLVRERRRFWASRPSRWMLAATSIDLALVVAMVLAGLLTSKLQLGLVATTLAILATWMLGLDGAKAVVFRRLGLAASRSTS